MKKLIILSILSSFFFSSFSPVVFANAALIPPPYEQLIDDPMSFVFSFLMTLFLTFIIEIPAVLFCLKFSSRHTEIRTSKIISANLIASSSTFLFFWIIIPLLILEGGVGYGYRMRIPITRNSYIYLAEIFITLIEALIYKRMLKLKLAEALITSLVANLASFWVGFYLLNGHIFITFIKKRFIIRFIPWW